MFKTQDSHFILCSVSYKSHSYVNLCVKSYITNHWTDKVLIVLSVASRMYWELFWEGKHQPLKKNRP